MKTTLLSFFMFFVITMVSSIAYSECRKSYVCDEYGDNCKYIDVCDDTLDLPSIDIEPLPALPPIELKPLPSIELPPLGTTKCEYMQVDGEWKNVCW